MNRKIAFRAWDKEGKVMHTDAVSCIANHEGACKWCFEDFVADDDYILIQFTGLTDKNGKEIWEGDIVHLDSWESSRCEVVFDRGAFCFRQSKEDNFYHDCKYLETGFVIGNIYENPELLK